MGEQDRCGWPVLDCTLSGENTRLLAALDAMTAERDAAYAKALEDAAEAVFWWWLDKDAESDQTYLPNRIRAMTEPKP